MTLKPDKLYHGSEHMIMGPLMPILRGGTPDALHEQPAVFATARADVAGLFMFPFSETIASIGFENDIAYICIWGTRESFQERDRGGFLYILPSDTFKGWKGLRVAELYSSRSY